MTRPFLPDTYRVEIKDWIELHTSEICDVCGYKVSQHAIVQGYTWLHRMCDGGLVKVKK